MEHDNQNSYGTVPNASAEFGNVRNDAEGFRTIPNPSERFGNVPQGSEAFRTVRNDSETFQNIDRPSERKENHTLTVREAARMFEAAGVARTERSIVNWCQPNRTGIARLDSYFDPNERKYYLTPESIERAIQEEIQRAKKPQEPSAAEPFGTVPKASEETPNPVNHNSENETRRIRELEAEVMDLKIVNKGKDYFIEQMQKERDGFVHQMLEASRKVWELETRLLQSGAPSEKQDGFKTEKFEGS
jgi:hypothetical protein